MSDDIVTQLREQYGRMGITSLRQAADEIERLRAELRSYTGDGHTIVEPFVPEAL